MTLSVLISVGDISGEVTVVAVRRVCETNGIESFENIASTLDDGAAHARQQMVERHAERRRRRASLG